MRLIKNLFIFLVFIVVTALVLSFIAPLRQKVEKSVIINASPHQVYGQIMLLQNINALGILNRVDSSLRISADGQDGVIGSKIKWEGSPLISGKGEVMLTNMKHDSLITHQIDLMEPRPVRAYSKFVFSPVGKKTELKWTVEVLSKRPFNIVNLFYSLEKQKGDDFDAGLNALKLLIETSPLPEAEFLKVMLSDFPFTNYVGIKQKVLWADYPFFFDPHFAHLNNYVLKGNYPNAIKTALIFEVDSALHQNNMAAAFPLPTGLKPHLNAPEQLIEVPASKSVQIIFSGREDVKQRAYRALDKFIAEKKIKVKKPVIEEYLATDSLPKTRIIYLVE